MRKLTAPPPAFALALAAATLVSRFVYGQDTPACTQDGPLGLISGEIRDWQITASSTFPAKWSRGCEERHARLYGPDGFAWCAQYKGSSEWLQVDLGVEATVTGVMTQGRGNDKDWVTWYGLSYSQDASRWTMVLDQAGKQKLFEANTDAYSVKHNYLDKPMVARFVRLHPLRYHRHPSMRVELVGCQFCKQQLALPPYARLTASSSRGRRAMRNCDASYGHTMSGKSWCARKQSSSQWLQVDLGPPARVTGVVTRGRGDGKEEVWVTAYRVAYGNDGKSWALYKDADHLSSKVFAGNHDRDSERVHYLNRPFTARYVRFHPVAWRGGIAMRVGVIGCQQQPQTCGGNGGAGDGSFFRFSNASRCLANLAHDKPAWVDTGLVPGGAGLGAAKHRKRQTERGDGGSGGGGGGLDSWVETTADVNSCVPLGPGSSGVGWLVDLKLKLPVQGVLLTANGNATNGSGHSVLDRIEVFVTKRSRRVFGGGEANSQQMKCGAATGLGDYGRLSGPRNVHIACSKTMLGRFIYIEAYSGSKFDSSPDQLANGGAAASSLCNLRVY